LTHGSTNGIPLLSGVRFDVSDIKIPSIGLTEEG
jgi:hypothetical protein